MKLRLILLILLSSTINLLAQEERITIVGSRLEGKIIGGESVREVIGDVVMTQGEVRITCDRALQYIARNEAILTGNVIAKQDTITIYTQKGYYYGNEKYTFSDTTVKLDDGHITLTADKGYYYFDFDRAEFSDNVYLVDTSNTLQADRLIYYNDLDKAVSIGNVRIFDEKSEILADSLIHLRNNDLSFAFSNIKISYPENNIIITGGYLEDQGLENYTLITKDPVLTQIDTSDNGEVDTLIVISKQLEAYQDSTNKLVASDSVRILRGEFFSVNNYSIFLRKEDKIITYKRKDEPAQPIVWYENSQLTGDSITVALNKNKIDWINIIGSSFILSKIDKYEKRFDQISGKHTKMIFENNTLNRTEVEGNVLSFYYLFEGEEPNGVLKSSSERTVLLFNDNTVGDVKLYGSIKSEYHPENLIEGKEREFTLPSFMIHENKPDKKKYINSIPNFNANIPGRKIEIIQ
jgi:lipopolysaccharide export system protein LptA